MERRPVIMIAESDPELRWLYRRWLEEGGWFVRAAEDGAWALADALPDPPDVMLVDQDLPEVDGLEVCRRMQSLTGAPRMVVMSAGADQDLRHRSEAAGADALLVKPFSRIELLTLVERLLECNRASRDDRIGELERRAQDRHQC